MAAAGSAPLLDLDRPRGVGALLRDAFATWLRHFPIFFAMAAIVVVPIIGLVELVWGESVIDEGHVPATWVAGSLASHAAIVPALVTAMHVAAVLDLAAGRQPSILRSLGVALRTFPKVAGAILLYALGVVVGLVFLVVPGLFALVVFYFGAQAVVVDRLGPSAALGRSAGLVLRNFWRAAGMLLLFAILSRAFAELVGAITDAVTDDAVAFDVTWLAGYAISISFSALAGTLLFFDLRARSR